MAKITISGVEYDLRMSLWASEQIENEFGDLKEALKTFQRDRKIAMVKRMFAILANAGRRKAKQPTNVSADVLDDCTLKDLDAVSRAMRDAMDEAMHAETIGGNEADDGKADALEAEYNEKNG